MGKFNQVTKPAFSLVTAREIADYDKGATLTKEIDIADYFREICTEADVTLTSDDAQITALVMSIPVFTDADGSTLEWESEVCAALESRNNSNTSDRLPDMRSASAVAVTSGSIATSEGERLDKNERFRKNMHDVGEAVIVLKRASLGFLTSVFMEHGYSIEKTGELTAWGGHLDMWPVPGSKPLDKDGDMNREWRPKKGERNLYAQYYITIGNDKVLYDWYRELILGTAEAKALQEDWDALVKAIPTKNNTPFGKYKGQGVTWLRGKKRAVETKINRMVSSMKEAMGCYFQARAIVNDPVLSKSVGVRFVFQHRGKDGNTFDDITDAFDTIETFDRVNTGYMQGYTLSAFNNLDVQIALDNGATWEALTESTAKGPNDKKSDHVWPIDMPHVLDNAELLAQFLTPTSTMSELISKANARVKGSKERTDEANHILVSLCRLGFSLRPFLARFGGNEFQYAEAKINAASEAEVKKIEDAA